MSEINLEGLFDALIELNFEIGKQFYAKPTHVLNPHDFYIIPYQFLKYLSSLSKPGRLYEVDELKVNATVVYETNNNTEYTSAYVDKYIRGVIQSVTDDKCLINALDLGFVENVPNDRIFHPKILESIAIPSLVQHCELDLCAPIGPNFNEKAIDAFKFYLGNEKLSITIEGKNADKLKVIVYNSNPDDISTLLALTHFTYLSVIRQDFNAMTVKQEFTFEHLQFSTGETIEVQVQSGTNLDSFYVTPTNTYKNYVKSRSDFFRYCKSVPVIKTNELKSGTAVGVEDERTGLYERGVILDFNETKGMATVKLVDWGTEVDVQINKIKRITTQLYTMQPASAIYCKAMNGFQPWNNGLQQFLYKGYSFYITFQVIGHGFKKPHIVLPTRIC